MKRAAILLEKNLTVGQKANVSAIVMGQLALLAADLFAEDPVLDGEGNTHSAIQYSTVLLEANSTTQIINLVNTLKSEYTEIDYVLFSREWQSLNNAFETYAALVKSSTLEKLWPVGIAIFWDDETVRRATKKFSLLK